MVGLFEKPEGPTSAFIKFILWGLWQSKFQKNPSSREVFECVCMSLSQLYEQRCVHLLLYMQPQFKILHNFTSGNSGIYMSGQDKRHYL